MRARRRALVVLAVGLVAALAGWWSLRRASVAPAEPQVRQAPALPPDVRTVPVTEAPPDAGRPSPAPLAAPVGTSAQAPRAALPRPILPTDAGLEPLVEEPAPADEPPAPDASVDAGVVRRECTLEGTVTLLRNGRPVPAGEGTVVVYVNGVRQRATNKIVTMLQENRQFTPRLLVLHTGDTVRFENRDPVDHSVFSNSGANTFDLPRTTRGVTGMRSFLIPGAVRIQCDIHASMRADVLVLENDYFSVASAGAWRIAGLPAGHYTVVAWEPNGGKTTRNVSACDGPVSLQVVESAPPEPRHKSGDRYSSEYDSP